MINKSLSIKEAAVELNLSEVYIRRLISQGKLHTNKIFISELVFKHVIDKEDLIALDQKHTSIRTMRNDGRNKYTLYARLDELALIEKYIKSINSGVIVERSNKTQDTKRRYEAQKQKKALLRKNTNNTK